MQTLHVACPESRGLLARLFRTESVDQSKPDSYWEKRRQENLRLQQLDEQIIGLGITNYGQKSAIRSKIQAAKNALDPIYRAETIKEAEDLVSGKTPLLPATLPADDASALGD